MCLYGKKSSVKGNSSDNNFSSCIDNKCEKILDRYMRLYGKKSSVKGNENEEISFFYDLENNTGFTNIFSFSCIPEFFLFSCLFFFLSYGILMKLSKQKKFPLLEKHNIFLICIILFFFIFLNLNYYIEDFFLYNSYFVHTKSSTIISCLISFFSIFTCLIMYNYVLKENIDNIEYYIILLSSIFSLCLLLQCNEVISFFFLLELQSICFYILSAFNRRYKLTIQSGIKYFIIGGVSSIFIIIGFTFFYYFTGSTSFEDFRMFFFRPSNFSYHEFLFNLGIFFLTIGLFMKLYISPFHWWILDVYEGSPSITTLFFSTVPYICFFFILYKIYFIIFLGNFFYYWFYFLLGSLLSMFIGSIGALLQKRIKRLIGYSSIGVIGYTLTIFLENYNFNYLEGIQLLFVYSICVFILFSFFFNINCVYLKKGFFLFIEYIEDIYLLRKLECNKAGKYLLSLGFYGILGLPPMPLFFQKFNSIKNIGISSNWFISFFFVLSSILSGFYYLYVIKEVFYHSFIYNTYRETMLYSLSFYNIITYLMFIFLFFEFYYLLTGCNFNFFIIH
jgi:NADH-quinone oxidoreductase subunit N